MEPQVEVLSPILGYLQVPRETSCAYPSRVNLIERAAEWSGWPLAPAKASSLLAFGTWLVEEAIAAGGVGPNEADRIEDRHLADSLLFAGGWTGSDPPNRLLDLGSGVGLPGVPLAILWPQTAVTLVDRSAKRMDMARRAGRMLGLENLTAMVGDAGRLDQSVDLVVARAAAPAENVYSWALPALRAGGRTVVGGSWISPPEPIPGERIVSVPAEVLDRPVWLRIMDKS